MSSSPHRDWRNRHISSMRTRDDTNQVTVELVNLGCRCIRMFEQRDKRYAYLTSGSNRKASHVFPDELCTLI